ncbi:restriction endonuclease subunit S [Helicobacter sp. T3_23-1056]
MGWANNLANLESEFIAQGGKWEEFRLIDMFNYKRGTRLVKNAVSKGDLPLLTAGEFNQGVKEFISNQNQQIFSNAITIDMFCNSFVHIENFCCDDNILVLNPKEPMNKYHLRFISTIINKDKSKYGYGKQYRMGSLENHKIPLPTIEGKIAFDFMEKFISAVQKEVIQSVVLWSAKRIETTKAIVKNR